ncbi:kinase-like protein [Massarina eburnea CBS 473.64]|uniref:Kinase-like protein n=1 Tax=Massarina eburnea CBS 473.64 TaxID=1395130 RepID=A0A6A6RIQ8_9PLEO|nr:kinase-like protein [Massarina eburnea CBS 473.64]
MPYDPLFMDEDKSSNQIGANDSHANMTHVTGDEVLHSAHGKEWHTLKSLKQAPESYKQDLLGLNTSGEPISRAEKSGASSFVVDGGDAKQLSNTASRFADTHDAKESRSLQDSLRKAILGLTKEYGSYFIPINKIDELITRQRILEELNQLSIGNADDREKYANDIWETYSSPKPTTRRKLFATLVLLEKTETILDFISEGTHDNDLPFRFSRANKVRYKNGKPVEAFWKSNIWKEMEKDLFKMYQWYMLSPYFEMSCELAPKVNHYIIEDRVVLPLVSQSTAEQTDIIQSGFSVVIKMKFHNAHYNADQYGNDQFFAVKELLKPQKASDDHSNKEVQSLIRLNNRNHEHLIRLLMTFEHKNHLNLVFPWAQGNLQDFWMEAYPDPQKTLGNRELSRWMAKQCLGISLALSEIHNNPFDSSRQPLQIPNTDGRNYGRHGDLKPENVLWFQSNSQSAEDSSLGILKVSDFGLVDFHGTHSKSRVPAADLGVTPTYRAPEFEVKKQVSQAYDIWGIGCIFLEFLEWYLRGKSGVLDFVQKRQNDHTCPPKKATIREDTFFNFAQSHREQPIEAIAKTSVHKEIFELSHHERSSDYILDFLDLVENCLLRMRPELRVNCDTLVQKLHLIDQNCSHSEKYCTERTKALWEKRTTDLSTLRSSNSLEMTNDGWEGAQSSFPQRRHDSGLLKNAQARSRPGISGHPEMIPESDGLTVTEDARTPLSTSDDENQLGPGALGIKHSSQHLLASTPVPDGRVAQNDSSFDQTVHSETHGNSLDEGSSRWKSMTRRMKMSLNPLFASFKTR